MMPPCPGCHQPTARYERLTGLWRCPCGYLGPISAADMVSRCVPQDANASALTVEQQRAITPIFDHYDVSTSTTVLAPSDEGLHDIIPIDASTIIIP